MALLAVLALPAVANTKLRSQRVACVNNLSRIGRAYDTWATDHAGRYPMTVPYWEDGLYAASPAPPGSVIPSFLASGLHANTWFQFWMLSNELASPKVLVCPSDTGRRRAVDFDFNPSGGFLHANFRDNAISYFLGHPLLEVGRAVFSGDRNVVGSVGQAGCRYFSFAWSVFMPTWNTNLHGNTGNLLFNDGSAVQTDNVGLRAGLTNAGSDDLNPHLSMPQPP